MLPSGPTAMSVGIENGPYAPRETAITVADDHRMLAPGEEVHPALRIRRRTGLTDAPSLGKFRPALDELVSEISLPDDACHGAPSCGPADLLLRPSQRTFDFVAS